MPKSLFVKLAFDRFGAVHLIDFHVGATSAHIVYVNEASAEAAVRAMRGFPLGGAENRIRVSWKVEHIINDRTLCNNLINI